MKTRAFLVAILLAFSGSLALRAADAPAKHDEEQTELGEHMEKLGGAYRRLGRQIADPAKNEDSLKLIATIRQQAEEAMKLQPAKTADLPEDQRAKFVSDYQAKMKGFIADVDKVAEALKAGNNDQAKQLLTSLKQDQKEGHHEFQKEKKKKM